MTTTQTLFASLSLHRSLATFVPALGALALGTAGCGAVEFGPAAEPNEVQRAALTDITEIAIHSRQASVGAAAPLDLLEIHARMSRLAPAARPDGTDVSVDESHLVLLDGSCASGSPTTGFDFDGCRLAAAGTSDPELRGQVEIRDGLLDFELTVPAESTRVGPTRLDGALAIEGSRVVGELRYQIGSDGVAGDPAGTWWVGGEGPHVRVTLVLDATLDAGAGCIAEGTAEVHVDGMGGEDSVRYELSSCSDARVRLERE
jgi:hypothetical protein